VKIALVTPQATAPGPGTGHERGTGLIALAPALAELGHDVTVYARKASPSLPSEDTVGGVTVHYVAAGPAAPLPVDDIAPHVRPLGDFLAERWRQDPPDLAHAYSWPGGLAALAGARALGVPVALTLHELGVQASLLQLRQARDQLARVRFKISLARNVAAVLARSAEEMAVLASLGVPRQHIRVVPWGVDTAHFGPDGPVAPRNGKHRLIAAWSAGGVRRADVLIRALADIPDTELLFVGGPPRKELTSSKLYRGLARLAARAQVGDRVTFTGGVAWPNLPPLLRSADLMVVTSAASLFDGAALQAMACGTALVAPAAGFYSDLIVDGTTGLLVQPGRPAGLARRIRRLLDSPVQLEAFGIAAADRARSRYSWDRIAREATRAYGRCLPIPEPEPVEEPADELAAAGDPIADLATAMPGA
jgi:glycosyltransferase involved in cell wall biosynthesis